MIAIPLMTRFRGIDVREGVLLRGDAGWGEFSPFLEYDDTTALPWLRAALEAAEEGWPVPVRASIPVNVTVPACDPERAREIVLASNGCRTAKVKVAEPGQVRQPLLERHVQGRIRGRVWNGNGAIDHLQCDQDPDEQRGCNRSREDKHARLFR